MTTTIKLSKEQKSFLHDIENKLKNITENSELLRKKVWEIFKSEEATTEEVEEIQKYHNLLVDYFLDCDQILVDILELDDND